ncbi:MAG: extracellular solute-binding protein, partial [Victivallales bacterium]|nr:extracellular solute-binding protein [Victivallales bacterium]
LSAAGVAFPEILTEPPAMTTDDSSGIAGYNRAAIEWNKLNTPKLELLDYQMTKDIFWPGQLPGLIAKGEILAAPTNASGAIIVYNKDIFDRCGVSYPEGDWTTDEFLDTCRKLSRKVPGSNVYESFALMPIWVPDSWLYLAGGRFYSEDGKECVLDSPEAHKAFEFLGKLWSEDAAGVRLAPTQSDSMSGASTGGSSWENFSRGKIAMVNAGRWVCSLTGPLFNGGHAPMPHFPGVTEEQRKVYFGGRTTAITRDSRHPEEAFRFLLYLIGREYGHVLVNSGDGVSGVRYYADEDWALFDPEFPEVQAVMFKRVVSDGEKSDQELMGMNRDQLAEVARKKWRSISLADKEKVKSEVSAMMRMTYKETANSMASEVNPYISENLFGIATRNITERVQNGSVPPGQWASELKREIDRHLSRALGRDDTSSRYFIGNIVGTIFIFSGLVFAVWWLSALRKKAGSNAQEHPGAKGEKLAAMCFLTPNLTGFAAFTFLPVIFSFVIAFTNFNTLTNEIRFVGFNNFVDQMLRSDFWYFLFNTFVFMLGLPISVALSLILALVLNDKLKGFVLFRTVFYLPSIVSGIAIFLLWKWMYNTEFGLINHLLRALWIDDPPNWLAGESSILGVRFFWAKPALIAMSVWMGMGGPNVLLFLAGLSAISPELYEASDIDGASKWQQFWNVTWPLLSPTTFFIMIMGVIGGLQGGFEMAYAMTQGGPQQSTTTLGYLIYNTAFFEFEVGQAAAIAWILFFLVFGMTIVNWKYGEKKVNY